MPARGEQPLTIPRGFHFNKSHLCYAGPSRRRKEIAAGQTATFMNASYTAHRPGKHRWQTWAGVAVVALLLGGLTACRTTEQVDVNDKEFSGFLGDYSALRPGGKGEANYLYIDKSVDFAHYTKVYIQSVELWKSDAADSPLGRLSPQNQQLLVDYFRTALTDSLERQFQMVNYGGPDVLVVRAAVTDGRKSRPVQNLVPRVVPAEMASSFASQPITGPSPGIKAVLVEADFTDGQTGRRVGAVVDARAGTRALRTKASCTWGDVKLAFDWWANRLALRLALFKQGKFSTDSL